MAEGILRAMLAPLAGEHEVKSAGTLNIVGRPPARNAQRAATAGGIDVEGKRSMALTPELLGWADVVLGMEQAHLEACRQRAAGPLPRLLPLGAGEPGLERGEVPDPVGQGLEAFEGCWELLWGWPLPLERWLESSFGVLAEMPPQLAPSFRLVEGDVYRRLLRSDRAHMRDADGGFVWPPPPWAAIGPAGGPPNFARFQDLGQPFVGEVLDLRAFEARFSSSTTMLGGGSEEGRAMGESKEIYRGRVVNLRQERVMLPSGVETTLDLMDHPGAAAIIAVDDEGQVVLIRQYRHAASGWLWEVPAGTLDEGELPLACARRELEEEAGVGAASFFELGFIYTAPGFCNERIWLYLAEGLSPAEAERDFDEVIEEVRRVPLEEALCMVDRGEIVDAKTSVGLFRAARVLAGR
jgi:ADP-ribose pyrophosphatase